jgi:hypothetical protein
LLEINVGTGDTAADEMLTKKMALKIHRGNFKNVTIDLAIHSAPIYRLQCISIARGKNLYLRKELKHMTIVRIFFLPFFKVYFVFS